MNKITLAVAVAAALGSSVAIAQTSVQLYGVADAGIVGVDRGADAAGASLSNFQVASGIQSASRFGIRGTEDLGSGLKAIFVAEGAWNVDEGTGDTSGALSFRRRSVVGLGGGFGTVLLGRDYMPAYHAGVVGDVFSFGMYGTAYLFGRSDGFTVRASNAIHYTSPNWGGLVLRAAYGTGERYETPKSAGNVGGLSLVYAGGPFKAAAYYQNQRTGTTTPPGTAITGHDVQRQFGASASYKFSAVRFAGGWGRSDRDIDSSNFDAWNLGVGVRIGAGELLAGFQRLTTDAGRNAALRGTAGVKGKANVYSVGYTYPMSKRTNVYATFGYTANDEGTNFGLATNSQTITAAASGEKIKALGLGVRHTF